MLFKMLAGFWAGGVVGCILTIIPDWVLGLHTLIAALLGFALGYLGFEVKENSFYEKKTWILGLGLTVLSLLIGVVLIIELNFHPIYTILDFLTVSATVTAFIVSRANKSFDQIDFFATAMVVSFLGSQVFALIGAGWKPVLSGSVIGMLTAVNVLLILSLQKGWLTFKKWLKMQRGADITMDAIESRITESPTGESADTDSQGQESLLDLIKLDEPEFTLVTDSPGPTPAPTMEEIRPIPVPPPKAKDLLTITPEDLAQIQPPPPLSKEKLVITDEDLGLTPEPPPPPPPSPPPKATTDTGEIIVFKPNRDRIPHPIITNPTKPEGISPEARLVRENELGGICPVCKTGFEPEDWVVECPKCKAIYHDKGEGANCWIFIREKQPCATRGCPGSSEDS